MLLDIIELRSPAIDPVMDDLPWLAPRPLEGSNTALNGTKGHYSTTFHWTARLVVLCRTIMDNLYSPWSRTTRSEQTLQEVSHQLDNWHSQFPLGPAHRFPLPHILLLHMIYHLMVIFVHRPFYRSASVSSAGKCDQAALSILQLLQLFDVTHGIRFCHHNLSKSPRWYLLIQSMSSLARPPFSCSVALDRHGKIHPMATICNISTNV